MSSLASPLNFGSANNISFCNFDGCVCLVRNVPFRRNGISLRKNWSGRRWKHAGVSTHSVTTAEQGTSISLDSAYRGSEGNAYDSFIVAAPKPVLKSGSKVDPLLNMAWDEKRHGGNSDDETKERSRVIESLGEVLLKAERLEISKKVNLSANEPTLDERADQENGVPVTKSVRSSSRKAKTLKSVWRKGNPVATVQKVFEPPWINGGGEAGSKTVAPFRPYQPPPKVEPKLPTKSLAAAPPMRKPVIFKDVNAAAKSPIGSGTDLGSKSESRKPILIDRFAAKKPVVDPVIAQAALAPPKPGKNLAPAKFKGEFRKKSSPSGGFRRRMVDDKKGIADEDSSEFDFSIPGAATARKGRKWSKASRKAARLQAARDAAPVRVEMMEVSEDGMLIDELAYNLAISEGEILGYMYGKGIRPDGVQKVSKEMVKMICKEYEVEVIDAVPVRVEDMAKKKEILDEDDLDKLEYRPPVLTIMGHVDHGKVNQFVDYFNRLYHSLQAVTNISISLRRRHFWILFGKVRYAFHFSFKY